MKNLKELQGVKVLSKKEQQTINGGYGPTYCWLGPNGYYCKQPFYRCIEGFCYPGPIN